ncbi:hypothetical protein [Chroococcidiopsis sp. CCMEE 29]|uniref:hypothetical protein n=1 Tax=Chroococcidiopsis sp. CCMEE 29 TaxID=155894 RepID=UPI0020200DD7|nr:hypothetical protein [Chroococcidiopsis sp. CCMEE 29]
MSRGNRNRPRNTQKPFKIITDQLPGLLVGLVATIILIVLLFLTGLLGDRATELANNIDKVPKEWLGLFLFLFSSVILALILFATLWFVQWLFRLPGVLNEVEEWFDPRPDAQNSRIREFVERIGNPDDPASLFHKILHDPSGALPRTIAQIHNHLEEVEARIQELKVVSKSYSEFQEWGNDWKKAADVALTTLEKETTLRNMMLLRPYDYIKFLEEADKFHVDEQAGAHIGTITLYGTMTGFAFLLPEAIRNHACRSLKDFTTIRILASDAYLDSKALVVYPLYLTCQIIDELLFQCSRVRNIILEYEEPRHEITVEIVYIPHDLFNAAILMEDAIVASLQALETKNFIKILQGERQQIGFAYKNTQETLDAYERYNTALNNMWEYHRNQRKVEKWTINKDLASNQLALKISNPHWIYKDGRLEEILQMPQDYDRQSDIQITDLIGDEIISNFLKSCVDRIGSGQVGSDVRNLKNLVIKHKIIWSRFVDFNCSCVNNQQAKTSSS